MASEPHSSHRLLVPAHRDADVSSLHSSQDTDSCDDEILQNSRTSTEVRAFDQGLLVEEEERNTMIQQSLRKKSSMNSLRRQDSLPASIGKAFGKVYDALPGRGNVDEQEPEPKRAGRKERRRRKKEGLLKNEDAQYGEDGSLMYELEQGGLKDGSSTGSSSDTESTYNGSKSLKWTASAEQGAATTKWRVWLFIYLLIGLLFALLFLGAWKLSTTSTSVRSGDVMFNNGTALFAPTTVLISLDGFRADFLQRGITLRLNAFIQEGISPVYMLPSFPSVTFPNHYTLVTGLYPESHGVVGNTFWDPNLKEDFFYTNQMKSMQSKWWGGEPLWVTAEKQGIRTAIHMWPGSEAHIMDVEPSFLDKYNGKEKLSNKADRVLELLDKPGMERKGTVPIREMRPQLIAAYVPNVDVDGHKFGPNSTEIRSTIKDVDMMLDRLFIGLEARNLTDVVNVVVVSDHGMATTSTDRLIQIDDLLDMNQIERTDGWPLYGLRPKNMSDIKSIYNGLVEKAKTNPGFEVYLRDENMPERWHFSKNDRIAPLWIIPLTGWAIVTKKEFNVEEEKVRGGVYHPRGVHGYDHENPLMRAIFVARGPAFPHAPNSRVEPFQNIEVYNIICDSLNLTPKPNNGTLRLPLKPVGTHSPDTTPDVPDDFPPSPTTDELIEAEPAAISISPIEASSAADPHVIPPHLVGVNPPEDVSSDASHAETSTTIVSSPAASSSGSPATQPEAIEGSWWDMIVGEIDGLGKWAAGIIGIDRVNTTSTT